MYQAWQQQEGVPKHKNPEHLSAKVSWSGQEEYN